jgi:predicted solute-binding protein
MQKGLIKQMDLGKYWEQKTKSPIPLIGIMMRNEFQASERATIDRLICDSLAYAEANYPYLPDSNQRNCKTELLKRENLKIIFNIRV